MVMTPWTIASQNDFLAVHTMCSIALILDSERFLECLLVSGLAMT